MSGNAAKTVSWEWIRARISGILLDGFRYLWALVYWNARKTGYVVTGRRGAPPCQNAYDLADGLAPQCEAVWHWSAAGRFRRVCPALAYTKAGWRCSATAAQVKPYWGRAVRVYGLLGAGLFLGGTGVVWTVSQVWGEHKIAYRDLVWPGNWEHIKESRAAHFRTEGMKAVTRGDFPAALLSLSTAESIYPGDYEQRLLLARLWGQGGNVPQAAVYFRGLMADYPQRAAATAVVWHDQLLALGDLAGLAGLCLERLNPGDGRISGDSLWEYSFLFALEHGRLAGALVQSRGDELARAPQRVRALVELLAIRQAGGAEEAVRRLGALRFAAAEPLAMRVQVEWLGRWGASSEAEVVLNRYARVLGAFEVAALRYSLGADSGSVSQARASFIGLLQPALTPAQADRLCGLVVTSRDVASLRRTPGLFAMEPLAEDAPSQAAFWVAALACESSELIDGARVRYERVSRRGDLPPIAAIDFGSASVADKNSPVFLANYVTLPRETIYALIGGMADRRSR